MKVVHWITGRPHSDTIDASMDKYIKDADDCRFIYTELKNVLTAHNDKIPSAIAITKRLIEKIW